MNNNKTLKLVISALLAAMVCVATMVIKIPIPATGGYINIGDCMVIVSGIILGPLFGGLAAGIGSALADILSGYLTYAAATFIIKALMAAVVGFIVKEIGKKSLLRFILAGISAEAIMIVGYFVFEAALMGYGLGALSAVPGNAIQGAAGIIISVILIPILKRIDIKPLRK